MVSQPSLSWHPYKKLLCSRLAIDGLRSPHLAPSRVVHSLWLSRNQRSGIKCGKFDTIALVLKRPFEYLSDQFGYRRLVICWSGFFSTVLEREWQILREWERKWEQIIFREWIWEWTFYCLYFVSSFSTHSPVIGNLRGLRIHGESQYRLFLSGNRSCKGQEKKELNCTTWSFLFFSLFLSTSLQSLLPCAKISQAWQIQTWRVNLFQIIRCFCLGACCLLLSSWVSKAQSKSKLYEFICRPCYRPLFKLYLPSLEQSYLSSSRFPTNRLLLLNQIATSRPLMIKFLCSFCRRLQTFMSSRQTDRQTLWWPICTIIK
jgi:hypothetical protein